MYNARRPPPDRPSARLSLPCIHLPLVATRRGTRDAGRGMRYARRKDKNHGEVVSAFRALGCSVLVVDCSQANAPDLLVGRNGVDQLVEVKPQSNVKRTSQLRPGQAAFAASWKGRRVDVARNLDDVARIANGLGRSGVDATRKRA